MRHLDLFSGIGGFTLAAQMVGGIETRQFVEIEPYCQKVLAKNFPGVSIHGDITTFTAELGQFDLITGGFPCQDLSGANTNGRGLEGERSGLFYELMRIVRECRPRYIVLENVAALLSSNNGRDMATVLWNLSESGFDAEWQVISAASVGAPHLRERVFIVAYRDGKRRHDRRDHWKGRHVYSDLNRAVKASPEERGELLTVTRSVGAVDANSNSSGREKLNTAAIAENTRHSARASIKTGNHWGTEPSVLRVANGVSSRLDRVKGLGNAIVPQCGAIALQRVLDLEAAA